MVTAYRCHVGSLLSTSHLYVTFCKSMHVGSKLKLTRTFFTNGLSALEDVSLLGEQISQVEVRETHSKFSSPSCSLFLFIFSCFFFIHLFPSKLSQQYKEPELYKDFFCTCRPICYLSPHSSKGKAWVSQDLLTHFQDNLQPARDV